MKEVSIIRYHTDASSVNSRINLEQHLFTFLLEGGKRVSYAGKQETISPEQFMLLSTGNCLMSEKTASSGGQYRSILLFFDKELLTDFLGRHSAALKIASNKHDHPFVVFEKDAFLVNFIESLALMLDAGRSPSAEMNHLKLEELLLHLYSHYPQVINQFRNSKVMVDHERLIHQAVNSVTDRTASVEDLAFLCHMSVSTFKRRFHEIYASTPKKWLLEKRMEKALYLLGYSGKKASEIYGELGYQNLSSFIQAFKAIHGTTPKKYQEKIERSATLFDHQSMSLP
ncbi:helix-turn-helix domain-containing protein [Pedobacter sp.]|uniref:helix-turn-helix domain-containing protein n=1 Tax=Pedobacter sp. TaxID=1411316 RepID=UPI003BA9FEFA